MPSLLANIGNTPMVGIERIAPAGAARILAKAEFMNPTGSIKDRIAHFILEEAEARGEVRPGSTILEISSGNTGIAFAAVGVEKGYRVVIMMPKTVSVERRKIIESYGAELELLEDLRQVQQAVERAVELAKRDPRIFLPRQFSNPDNPRAHEGTTGPEILKQAGERVDAFVMGVGTGGTLMGVGRALRKTHREIRIVAVEPAESAVLSGGNPGVHGIQGLADGFVPEIVRREEIDRVERVTTADAVAMAKRLAREQGLFVGISAGANVAAAIRIAAELGEGRTVVTVLPDRGERYLSVW